MRNPLGRFPSTRNVGGDGNDVKKGISQLRRNNMPVASNAPPAGKGVSSNK